MTRVAMLPSAYLPDLGGVEEMSHQLALSLKAAGDSVEVWTAKVPAVGKPSTSTIDGIDVTRFPFPLPARTPSSLARFPTASLATLLDLRRAARRFRPELLHVQCFGPNGVYAAALSALIGVPLVLTLHGETLTNDNAVFDRSVVLRKGLEHAISRAAVVTGCSAFALDDAVQRFGLDRQRAQVIFNGIDLSSTATSDGGRSEPSSTPATPATPADQGPLEIISLGRMTTMKGFDLLLDAFARVAEVHPLASLVLAGDGADRQALERQAERLGLADRVRFPGRIDRQQVAMMLSDATLCAVPSRLESFGIVILEAWKAGIPVIATTRGGPPEFVTDGVDGLLVDPLDVASFSEALDRLLRDPAATHRMGLAGQERAKDFDWPDVAQRYRAAYERALATSS